MKKVFYLLMSFGFLAASVSVPTTVKAQTIKSVIKSITSTDTTTFANVPSKIKGFQYTFTESSGTTSGKVYMEGTVNGTYVLLDSLTLSDVTTAQTKYFKLTSTDYLSYRFRNSAAITGAIRVMYIRRTDE
jgi:hypothetical protein